MPYSAVDRTWVDGWMDGLKKVVVFGGVVGYVFSYKVNVGGSINININTMGMM